jgi:hypothetical protein
MTITALNAVEMFNELVRQGYVVPINEHPDLTLPSAYRTVPTMTLSGTGYAEADRKVENAQLDSSTKGNIQDIP